jgi:hypothetical protein
MELFIDNHIVLIDDEDYDKIKDYKWYIVKDHRNYYVMKTQKNHCNLSTIRMHTIFMNPPKGLQVDHINGNGLDNRKCNLRIVTPQQNQMNKCKQINSSSIYKGVHWETKRQKWRTQIYFKYHRYYLGYYKSEIEAAVAYNEKAKELFGEYARLNVIE